MRFLAERALYARADDCLRYLRELGDDGTGPPGRRYHLYWAGPFGRKQAFALKSLLATQDLGGGEVWLWLEAKERASAPGESPFLRPLLPFVRVRRFDPAKEAVGTPAHRHRELYAGLPAARRSNLVRFLALYKYGGIYADMDTMFLRDLGPLLRDPRVGDEFCYQWATRPFGNSAVFALRQGSATAEALLRRCAELGTCRPQPVLDFAAPGIDLLVLPCAFFDPLWGHHDGRERAADAPFARFDEFFTPVEPAPPCLAPVSYRNFFRGAFTYHWHNCWAAPEAESSYFSRFDRELDEVLRHRLAVEPPSARDLTSSRRS
jgi:hypothetical protein